MNLELINSRIEAEGFSFRLSESDFDNTFHRLRSKEYFIARYTHLKNGNQYFFVHAGDYRQLDKKKTITLILTPEGLEQKDLDSKSLAEVLRLKKQTEKLIKESHIQVAGFAENTYFERGLDKLDELSNYEEKKGIPRTDTTQVVRNLEDNQKVLMVPAYDDDEKIWNIQSIFANGTKIFMKGGRKNGLHHLIRGNTHKIYVCEGYATGVAINAATGQTVVVAFDAGNLEAGYLYARKVFASSQIVIAADWDGKTFLGPTGKNPGAVAARDLAKKAAVKVAFPLTEEGENKDFADLWPDTGAIRASFNAPYSYSELANLKLEIIKPKTPGPKKKKPAPSEGSEPKDSMETSQTKPEQNSEPAHSEQPKVPDYTGDEEVAIDPANYAHMEEGFFYPVKKGNNITWRPDFDGFAAYMGEKYRLVSADGFDFIYADGYFQRLSKLGFLHLIQKIVRENTAPSDLESFRKAAQAAAFMKAEDFKPQDGYINLSNGVLDVKTRKLFAHSPYFKFTYKLAHPYVEGEKCLAWRGFLMDIFEGNQELSDVMAEIFGYVLVGGTPFLHKIFVLEGAGRNGKSTLLDVLKYMIGQHSVSGVRLEMLDRPFSVVQAHGKLVNIVGEASKGAINSDLVKSAAAGEPITAAFKGVDEFDMPWFARIIIACNKLPVLGDTTVGIQDRMFIVPFNRYLKEEERVVNIAQNRLFPEISGILNWALEGLERLSQRGRLPTIEAVKQANRDMRLEADPFFLWWTEHFSHNTADESRLKVADLYSAYRTHMQIENKIPMSKIGFGKKLKSEVLKDSTLRWTMLDGYPYVRGHIALLKNPNGGAGFRSSIYTDIPM